MTFECGAQGTTEQINRAVEPPAGSYYHTWGLDHKTLCGLNSDTSWIVTGPSGMEHVTCPRCNYVLENRCVEDGSTFDEHFARGFEEGLVVQHAPEFTDIQADGQKTPVAVNVRCSGCGWTPEYVTRGRFTGEVAYVEHIRKAAQRFIPSDFVVGL